MVNYDESFMIHLYVHLFFLYILNLGAVYKTFASVFCPGRVLAPWCCLRWRAAPPRWGGVQGISGGMLQLAGMDCQEEYRERNVDV